MVLLAVLAVVLVVGREHRFQLLAHLLGSLLEQLLDIFVLLLARQLLVLVNGLDTYHIWKIRRSESQPESSWRAPGRQG